MISNFIDSWWEKEYPNHSIKSRSSPIFLKYNAIKEAYKMTLENIEESLTDDENTRTLEWHDTLKFKGQKLIYFKADDSFYYEHWYLSKIKLQKNEIFKIQVTEKAWHKPSSENGETIKKYPNYEEKTIWKIEQSCENNEHPVFQIFYTGKRESSKGVVDFEENVYQTQNLYKKNCSYVRGTRQVLKQVLKENGKTVIQETCKDEDLYKAQEIIILNDSHETGKKVRTRRDETQTTT